MDQESKKALKEQIQRELAELDTTIQELEAGQKPVAPDRAIGRVSRIDAITSQGVSEAALTSSRNRRARYQNVLKKIDDPDYGFCRECGGEISLARLKSVPESTRCMECLED